MLSQCVCIFLSKAQIGNKGGNTFLTPKFLKFKFLWKAQFVSIFQISKIHRKCEGVQLGHLEFQNPGLMGDIECSLLKSRWAGRFSALRAFMNTARGNISEQWGDLCNKSPH